MKTETIKSVWYREPFVWMILALLASAVGGSFASLYYAIESDDGVVVDDYYQAGKHINQVLDRDHAARTHALKAQLQMDYAKGMLHVRLSAKDAKVLPSHIDLRWLNATRAVKDRDTTLSRTPDGSYDAPLPPLPMGHWYVQLEANDWRLVGSLQVPTMDTLLIDANPPVAEQARGRS
jgi:hypothetical protein